MKKSKRSDQNSPQQDDHATFGEEAQVASDVALNTLSKLDVEDTKVSARKVVAAFKKVGSYRNVLKKVVKEFNIVAKELGYATQVERRELYVALEDELDLGEPVYDYESRAIGD